MTAKIAPEAIVPRHVWADAATPARDLARFGIAIVVAAAFSAVQLFVIPRRVDMATYGHYRLFLLFAGYFGVLHLGIADGAFLRWAGRRTSEIRREWTTVVRWLLALHGVLLLVAIAAAFIVAAPLARLYVGWLAAAALCANAATLASFALQAGGDFKSAGRVAALAPAMLVVLVLVLPVATLASLFAIYAVSAGVAALYGAARVLGSARADNTQAQPLTASDRRSLITTGLPVLGANLAAGLAQSADRILVSLAAPITSFALYGFASTLAVVSATVTHTLSRVALSHAATRPASERSRFLAQFLFVIAAGYGVALLGEPLFEHLVRRMLPAYGDALPIVRAMIAGMPFWIALHVALVGTLQSHGLVRRQLALEACGVAVVAGACGAALLKHAPLWVVAAAASAAGLAMFALGLAAVHRAVGSDSRRAAGFALVVSVQFGALLLAHALAATWPMQLAIYLVIAALPTAYAWSRVDIRAL